MDINILQLFKYGRFDTMCGSYKYFFTSDEWLVFNNSKHLQGSNYSNFTYFNAV